MPQPLATVLCATGAARGVYLDADGRQYVHGDDGARAYGVWFIPEDAPDLPLIVEAEEGRTVSQADAHRLLHGPYRAPPLRKGDRATCLFRDATVVITSISAGRIPWPRCQVVGQRGGSGLLVDDELARAVRCESSLAIQHWWGVTEGVVWRWRQALGVERFNEGSALLRGVLNELLGAAQRGRKLPPEQVEQRRRTALELGLRPGERWGEKRWQAKELALLGKLPAAEVAQRIGRTETAVRVRRLKLGIRMALDRRLRPP